jgi:hypothetical protein
MAGCLPTEPPRTAPCLLAPDLHPIPITPVLPSGLLTLLPALVEAATWEEAAERAGFSRRHLQRKVSALRAALHLTPERLHPRAPPPCVAQAVLAALAAPLPPAQPVQACPAAAWGERV